MLPTPDDLPADVREILLNEPELFAFLEELVASETEHEAAPNRRVPPDLQDAMSVRELARQIKRTLEHEPTLQELSVRGEVSNYRQNAKGHCYFTLKDADAQVKCIIWRKTASALEFRPSDGHRIVARGSVEFYSQRGDVSFIVDDLEFDGRGALFEAYEQLKLQLATEGLFDPERKKPLPAMPQRIGLVTSSTGAVMHDVVTTLRRRFPLASVTLIPAQVQGFGAAPDLVRALSWASALEGYLDVVIVARGGGSAEDLWAFNDEELARAAAEFPMPLVSAIGHETDFSILDFVADVRAATPTAAAELVSPDASSLQAHVDDLKRRLQTTVATDVERARARLNALRGRGALQEPARRVANERERVSRLAARAQELLQSRVKIERRGLEATRAQLRALDPQRVLERGFTLLTDAQTGALLTLREQTRAGQNVRVRFADGEVPAALNAEAQPNADA